MEGNLSARPDRDDVLLGSQTAKTGTIGVGARKHVTKQASVRQVGPIHDDRLERSTIPFDTRKYGAESIELRCGRKLSHESRDVDDRAEYTRTQPSQAQNLVHGILRVASKKEARSAPADQCMISVRVTRPCGFALQRPLRTKLERYPSSGLGNECNAWQRRPRDGNRFAPTRSVEVPGEQARGPGFATHSPSPYAS